jgi:hypothetical protein
LNKNNLKLSQFTNSLCFDILEDCEFSYKDIGLELINSFHKEFNNYQKNLQEEYNDQLKYFEILKEKIRIKLLNNGKEIEMNDL